MRRPPKQYGTPEALSLHRLFPPIDLHADTLMWMRSVHYDIGKRHEPPLPRAAWVGHVDLPRLEEINANAQFFGIATGPLTWRNLYRLANEQIDQLEAACAHYSNRIVLARTVSDVLRARSKGQVAALLSLEGAHFLEGDVRNLRRLAKRGLRTFGLVHLAPNTAAYPNYGLWTCEDEGLSDFGRRLVHECNRLGVILDLAHINLRGFMEVVALSRQPVMVSHTGIMGVHRHRRNINDEQLRAVADTGGVIGIMYEPRYLGGPGIATVMSHLRHVIDTVGEEHVALGSDWDGMITPTRGLEHIGRLPNLTDAMLRAGWSDTRIGRILCQNVLRVLRDVRPKK